MPGRFADTGDKHVARRGIADSRRVAQGEQDMAPGYPVEAAIGLDKRRDRDRRVVHQPLADPRHLRHNVDPEITQMAGWPDSGAQQMRRRMDRPRRDDNLSTT